MGEVVLALVILDSEIIYLTLIRSNTTTVKQATQNTATHKTTKALPNVSLKVWNEASEFAFKNYFLF
jgi:hypothetical protein